jgi:hypothetical protein
MTLFRHDRPKSIVDRQRRGQYSSAPYLALVQLYIAVIGIRFNLRNISPSPQGYPAGAEPHRHVYSSLPTNQSAKALAARAAIVMSS